MNLGFPEKTDSFYRGQDILYGQFNEINFYVEDEGQENLYYVVLRKLFPDIEFKKIFPLNGKDNVIADAIINGHNKKNIYLVDKDFDDIHGIVKNHPNLFYLKEYSIENYLLEENAILEFVIEEKPKLKRDKIAEQFDLNGFINESVGLFKELVSIYLVIQEYDLGIDNVRNSVDRFCAFNPNSKLREVPYNLYHQKVESALKAIDGRLSIKAQKKKYFKHVCMKSNIPGKYLLQFLKHRISHIFRLQVDFESFVFRLAKNCSFNSLRYLIQPIQSFIY